MSTTDNVRKPSGARRLLTIGIILLVIAVVGILYYTFTSTAPAEGTSATGDGVWQGLTIVISAACGGVGALLLVLGLVKRGSAKR